MAAHEPQPEFSIIACAVQQQVPDGPLAGMYPDAYSVVKGDEEYT